MPSFVLGIFYLPALYAASAQKEVAWGVATHAELSLMHHSFEA